MKLIEARTQITVGVRAFLFMALISAWVSVKAAGGFDVGVDGAVAAENVLKTPGLKMADGMWLRIRGLSRVSDGSEMARERAALKELRGRGLRICALVEWDEASWLSGVRSGGGRRVALDLREVWERARALGRAFAGRVDVWEIGNEPDISFLEENPETYAAYLKTCRLGLIAGAEEAEREWRVGKEARKGGRGEEAVKLRVLMAPLALPPGPYFERLWENGAGGATDGFNFHYYGYAEDFSDVYEQFRDAVESEGKRVDGSGRGAAKNEEAVNDGRELPVFVTEYGYGLMDDAAGKTEDGRARQMRWFRDVGAQIRVAKPEAAMAFVLTPYLEQRQSEFGLLTDGPAGSPGPFAATGRISPALTWLLQESAQENAGGLSWRLPAAASDSPVVMDFVGRDGLEQRKSFRGYFVEGISGAGKPAGWGEMVVYNFSEKTVEGVLKLGDGLTRDGSKTVMLSLASKERRSVRVRVELTGDAFQGLRSESVFSRKEEAGRGPEVTRLVTTLWPDPAVMRAAVVSDFSHDESSAAATAERLLARWRAGGEPALLREGRWLVSRGVSVAENDEASWRFTVKALPEEPSRPAMVELPLPADFVFAPGMLLEFSYRLAEGSAENAAWFDVYFRTENGNLYQVWPRLQASRAWRGYAEATENFSMAFYGRAKLPWRFSESKPVALVFFLRPEKLPAVFEVEGAAITRRVAE